MQTTHSSAILLLALLGISSHISAASFEVLFQIEVPYGEKSVLVSDDGSAVLSVHPGSGQFGSVLWRQSQGIVSTWPTYTGGGGLVPACISGDGQVIFGYYPGTTAILDASYNGSVQVGGSGGYPNGQATVFISGQPQVIGKLDPDTTSIAWGVSADGKTVVGASGPYPAGREAIRWTNETGLVALGMLPGATTRNSSALGISPAGDTIVGVSASANSGEEAFRWTSANGMQPLGDLPGGPYSSDAYAASSGGNFIVGISWATHGNEAFLWDSAHGMRSLTDLLTNDYHLDLHGLKLMNATDISASGDVIVGWASDGNNHGFAFRVDLVPEPSTLMLFASVIALLPYSRKRRATLRR